MKAELIKLPSPTTLRNRPWCKLGHIYDVEDDGEVSNWLRVLGVPYRGNYVHLPKDCLQIIEEEPNGWNTP